VSPTADRQALDRALAEAELLNDITEAAAGEEDLDRLLDAALGRLNRVIPFTGGSIAMVEEDELVVRAAVGPFAAQARGQRLGRGPARTWRIVETGQPFRSDDLAAEGLRPTTAIRSFLGVPLAWRGSVFGVLEVDSTRPGAFGGADQRRLERVATVLSGSIELVRRYEAEARAAAAAEAAQRRLAFLAEASVVVSASLNYDATLARVTRLAVPTVADWCRIYMRDGQTIRRVAVAYADPAMAELDRQLQQYPPSPVAPGSVIARALETGESQLSPTIPDEYVESIAQDAEHLALLRRLGFRSSLVVPLRARGRVLGALACFMAESGRQYGPEDLTLCEDLAQRAAMAVDNARLYEELADAVQLRDHFLAAAAHDLKTPLTAIKVTAQLVGRQAGRLGEAGERIAQAATRIDANTARMVGLIDELLDVASLQVGEPLKLSLQPTDLATVARLVAIDLEPTARKHRIVVEADGPVLGTWDRVRLERVIANLVGNAIKYSPAGGSIRIGLRVETDERGRGWAVMQVRDRGVGIPKQDLPHVFERFHRGANVEREIAGTGLGLFGSGQIVAQHGGAIEVESEEGVGSTFTVRLPLEPPEEDAGPDRSSAPAGQ
jgi:signal transduction histidine kinase/putative methionine-R-sulfoxide reductase with GAF domain